MYNAVKRFLDVFIALTAFTIFLPFLPLIILIIKLDSEGPAIIRLNRVSKGKLVRAFKFRTMVKNAHTYKISLAVFNERKDGPFFKMSRDPRITRVGRWLRKFHIDEIPQLINVITGDLSLVGPRPHEPEEVIHYPGEYKHLLLAKAGVTGLSQVNGASSLPFLRELTLDAHYVKNQSLWFDFKILFKTIFVFLRHRGV